MWDRGEGDRRRERKRGGESEWEYVCTHGGGLRRRALLSPVLNFLSHSTDVDTCCYERRELVASTRNT